MSEERLQEIKDSVNFQYELIVSKGIDKSALLFTDEEQELIEEIERLNKQIEEYQKALDETTSEKIDLKNIIKEVREYIENNDLYEQDYDYDYEENLTEYPPSDEQARKDILSILDKENQ